MKNNIVDDGFGRLRWGQKVMSSESIEKKYATELAQATPDQKKAIYARMLDESEKREKMINHQPSAKTLW